MYAMPPSCELHLLFYSHPWLVTRLDKLLAEPMYGTVLVELATPSTLAAVFDKPFRSRPGITGVLAGTRLRRLARRYRPLAAPLVLGSYPELPPASLEAAVALLAQQQDYRRVILLAHPNDAGRFREVYARIDRFGILWDVEDPPGEGLAQLTRTLADSGCLTPQRWGGFQLCRDPRRSSPGQTARQQQLQQVLDEFPLAAGAA